jgi:hypothetical protein
MAKTDAAADGGQGELDMAQMAEMFGLTLEEMVAKFISTAASDESTRGILLNETAVVSAGMTPEENSLSDEIVKVRVAAERNRVFTEPRMIPDAWLAKFTEWFEAGLMPPATVLVALGWLSLNDKTSTEATFGRYFDGIGNQVTYPSRLANARRRAFLPDFKKFGKVTIGLNGKVWSGDAELRKFMDEEIGMKVPASNSSLSTYVYRATRDDKMPADTKIHSMGIPGCTPEGVGVDIARYYEWYTNHRADVSNGVILSKDGEMVEITDYQAEHPPEPEPGSDDGDDDDEDYGDDSSP